MRGWSRWVKGAVFIGALLGASVSSAQQDPRVWVYFDNVATCPAGYTPQIGFDINPATGTPYVGSDGFYVQKATCVPDPQLANPSNPTPVLLEMVSLTRTVGTTTFTARSAYDLGIWNNNTNSLNRLYFRVAVANPAGSAGDSGKIERLVNGAGFSCYRTDDPAKAFLSEPYDVSDLTCTSTTLSLPPKGTTVSSRAVTIVVKTPSSGGPLRVTASAGGYEGSSQTGQGCCAIGTRPASTVLIDSVASGEYTYSTTTFVSSDEPGVVFTGNGQASGKDLFATNVTVPTGWGNNQYDRASLFEKTIPEGKGRCKQSKLKYCHESTISLPNVVFTPPDLTALDVCDSAAGNYYSGSLLEILLTVDFSSVKGNPKVLDLFNDIRIAYTEDASSASGSGSQIYRCSPSSGWPCICDARPDGNTIRYLIKSYKNGRYEVF